MLCGRGGLCIVARVAPWVRFRLGLEDKLWQTSNLALTGFALKLSLPMCSCCMVYISVLGDNTFDRMKLL
jgi:hypothetical protein